MKSNPFVVSGYRGPRFFCDREEETQRILSAIHNQRHLTLFSLRRMGKTGLIHHVFHELAGNKEITPVYLDIMPTLNFPEFTMNLAKAIFSKLARRQSLMKSLLNKLSSLRPSLTYDPVTGAPEISIRVDKGSDLKEPIETIFQVLSNQKQYFVIAIDEFQQVASYPEKEVEAILRSQLHRLDNVSFLFSGSQRRILSDIFSSPNRPFFNSTEIMEIGPIQSDVYKNFIQSAFHNAGKVIDDDALSLIEDYTFMHTFYVQFLCNRLIGSGVRQVTTADMESMYRQVLMENEPVYASYRNLLTSFQFRLLRAIARERGAIGLTSKEFLDKHDLGAASSVNTAMKSLQEKDFVFQRDDAYYLVDKFLEGWLRYIA
jgi:uncharacterized protein